MDTVTEPRPQPATPDRYPEGAKKGHGDLEHARFMALDSRAVSAEATALVDAVTTQVERWERETKARTYQRRGGKRQQFKNAIGAVVADLVLALDRNHDGWAFRPMAAASFSEGDITYTQFRPTFQALIALGLVRLLPGFFNRSEGGTGGKATRLRASPVLISLIRDHGIQPREARHHFQSSLPGRPLVLKASSVRHGGRKTSGQRLRFTPSDRSRRLEAEVREIDGFIAQHELRGGTHRGYRRIFNCGDDPAFDWNKGGRLYSAGEDSYQRHSKEDRLRMRIDGEPVAEIDIRASYLTILHAIKRQPLDTTSDPYAVEGLPRAVVKAWVTMTLGHDKFHCRWPTKTIKKLSEQGILVAGHYPVKQVQRSVTGALPVLADWPECRVTCFDLMYLESEAMLKTMLRLKHEAGAVSLSVHDSILVPRGRVALAEEILVEEYQRVVGVRPGLKTHYPVDG